MPSKAQQYQLPTDFASYGTFTKGDVCPTTGTIFVKPVPKLIHTKGLVVKKGHGDGSLRHIATRKDPNPEVWIPYAKADFDFKKTYEKSKKMDKLVFGVTQRASRAEFCFLPSGEMVGSADVRIARGDRNPKDQAKYAKLCKQSKEERIALIETGTLVSKGKVQGKKVASPKHKSKTFSKDINLMKRFIELADVMDALGYDEDLTFCKFPFDKPKYTKELERLLKQNSIALMTITIAVQRDPAWYGSIKFGTMTMWEEQPEEPVPQVMTCEALWKKAIKDWNAGTPEKEDFHLNLEEEEKAFSFTDDEEEEEPEPEPEPEPEAKKKSEVIALAEGGDLVSQLVLKAQAEAEPEPEPEAKPEPEPEPEPSLVDAVETELEKLPELPAEGVAEVEMAFGKLVKEPKKSKGKGKGKAKKPKIVLPEE